MNLILHQCEPHHPSDHLETVPRVYVKVSLSCKLFAWILTQCFVVLCQSQETTKTYTSTTTFTSTISTQTTTSITRSSTRTSVTTSTTTTETSATCLLWNLSWEFVSHIKHRSMMTRIPNRRLSAENGGNCLEVIILIWTLWSCGIMIRMQYAETQWYAHALGPAMKLFWNMSLCTFTDNVSMGYLCVLEIMCTIWIYI